MRMTSAEKLILENQSMMLMALSVLTRACGETITATALMSNTNKTLQAVKDAKIWSNE